MSQHKKPKDRLPKKKAITRRVRLGNDSEVTEKHEALTRRVVMLEMRLQSQPDNEATRAELEIAKKELEEFEPTMEENSILFEFRAIGRKKLDRLLNEHPPTEEQIEQFEKEKEEALLSGDEKLIEEARRAEITWNYDTYPKALIAATMIKPIRVDYPDDEEAFQEVVEWLSLPEWNDAEIQELFAAALMANNTRAVVSMGKGSSSTRNWSLS